MRTVSLYLLATAGLCHGFVPAAFAPRTPTSTTTTSSSSSSGSSSSLWNHPPSSQCVVWQIPIPAVAPSSGTTATTISNNNKTLSIGFAYHEEHHIVTAKILKTVGIDDKLMDLPTSVLQLNPNDTGSVVVKDPGSDHAAEAATATTPYGKPYLWCNYLAGLQLMQGQHPHEQMTASTRVIVATMLRQIKTNATLTYILHKVLPSHPRASALPPVTTTTSGTPQCLAKVSSFQLDKDATTSDDTHPTTKTYKIVCKRGNHSLQASVQINTSHYPVVTPPKWSLTGNTLQWGQDYGSQDALLATDPTSGDNIAPPLHRSRLAALESRVNDMDGLVEHITKKEQPKDDATTNDESYYYDWILTHQLREILLEWDAWVSSGGDNSAGSNDNGIGGGRSVRGRDRAKVE